MVSASPRIPESLLTGEQGLTGLRMTADEYLAIGETTDRYELVDGVGEYWVVDPADGSVRQFVAEPPGGPYPAAKSDEGDRLGSMVIEGFSLDLAPIRALAG